MVGTLTCIHNNNYFTGGMYSDADFQTNVNLFEYVQSFISQSIRFCDLQLFAILVLL